MCRSGGIGRRTSFRDWRAYACGSSNLPFGTTTKYYAEVVELVDTLDLGSSAARRGSSSLLFGTIIKTGS